MTERNAVHTLLGPKSIAVIGATERPDASSSFVMRNLIQHQYPGAIYPVHPRAEEIYGYPAYASLAEIAVVPEVAIICIRAEAVAAALRDVGRKGTRAAIILSSGFAEAGEAGARRQAELEAIAAEFGLAVCGPNCLGIVSLQQPAVQYSSRFPQGVPEGSFALISQSGATAIALSGTGRIGFSHIISAGNCAVTGIADYIEALADDPHTVVIGLVLENIARPQPLANAIGKALRAGKPVLALYFGRTRPGAVATTAHTGALASSFEAVASFMRRHGVISVKSMDDFLACSELFTKMKSAPPRAAVTLVGVSGGALAHVTDVLTEEALSLAPLSAAGQAQLSQLLPPFISPQNPLDMTGLPFADGDVYRQALAILAADPACGLLVVVQDVPAGLDEAGAREYLPIAEGIRAYAATATAPLVVITNLAGGFHPLFRAALAASGIPLLAGTAPAIKAIKARLQPLYQPAVKSAPAGQPQSRWLKRFSAATPWREDETKGWLAAHGLRTTTERLVTSAEAAVGQAQVLGFPVVLKVASTDIQHKSDLGGLQLNLASADEVRRAYTRIMTDVAAQRPDANIAGMVVSEMVPAGIEMFVGVSRRLPFGHGLLVGVGGLHVELLGGHRFELLPLDRPLAEKLVLDSVLGEILAGYRGQPAGDSQAVIKLLLKISRLIQQYGSWIDTLELNPVTVLSPGQGICILDALLLNSAA